MLNWKQEIEKANKRISVLNRAVDQARDAGNEQAAEVFQEDLTDARDARLLLGNDDED